MVGPPSIHLLLSKDAKKLRRARQEIAKNTSVSLSTDSFIFIDTTSPFFARAKFDTFSNRNFDFELGKKPGLATHYPVGHLIDMHIMNLTRHVIE